MNAQTNVRAMRAVEPSPLLTAIANAIATADHASACLHGMTTATETEIDAAEDAAWTAKQALIAEFAALGVPKDMAAKIGGVL